MKMITGEYTCNLETYDKFKSPHILRNWNDVGI
jgi:hypothetical protein